jgi:hypothetical protein
MFAFFFWVFVCVCVGVFIGPEWAGIPAFFAGVALVDSGPPERVFVVEHDAVDTGWVQTVWSPSDGEFIVYAWDLAGDAVSVTRTPWKSGALRKHKELAARMSTEVVRDG